MSASALSPVATATVAPQPRTSAAACLPAVAPRGYFFDVDPADVHAAAIDCLWWWGIARGTTDGTFLPGQAIRRDEAASLLARLVLDTGGTLPDHPPAAFPDTGSAFASDVDALAAAGVVAGYPNGTYRPAGTVSRGQLATLVVRTYQYRTGKTLTASTDYFPDVSASMAAPDINGAAAAGLVSGYLDGTFRPDAAATREQVATVQARLLDLLVDSAGAHPPGTGATISSVTPVATGRMLAAPAENTSFCIYDVAVSLSWLGATRVDAFPLIDGTRMAPGDTLNLVADGSTTVTVQNVLVPLGKGAQVEAVAGQITNGDYKVLADVTDSRTFTCPFPG